MKLRKWVGLNLDGRRVGQEHPRAKTTDREVELAIWLRSEGFTLEEIAKKMEVNRSTVCRWLKGGLRGQPAVRWKHGEYKLKSCSC